MDKKQIALRLSKDVLAEAEALAECEERKLATMLILLIKRGITFTKQSRDEQ
jgi:hypothetical protein